MLEAIPMAMLDDSELGNASMAAVVAGYSEPDTDLFLFSWCMCSRPKRQVEAKMD